ncbi:MAG TPA: response regulator, partial [Bacteroidales bacterium]|nr:response regulator [Bacteroidales bacterium]
TMPEVFLHKAENGERGLKLLNEILPDVILLDLVMPGMDGFEVLKRIRNKGNGDYIPVIMLTAAGEAREKRIKALEIGADAFLSKPVDEAELVAQIKAMIRIREMEKLKRHEAERLSMLVAERTRDLQLAKEKAEESDKLKTAFLHNISHEIRTPLNAIIGFTSVLAKDDLPANKRKEFLDIIYKSNDQLLSIISSIIALASLESGQETVRMKETHLNQLLRDVYKQFLVTPLSPDVTFSYHAGLSEENAFVMTDPVKLMQILVNLISNAYKFTCNGYIKFGYILENGFLEFYVEDSGIGIPEELHGIIFERFRQIDNTATRKYGGTGLGLALSKGYAELLGGNIQVASAPKKGAKFSVNIPYNPVKNINIEDVRESDQTSAIRHKSTILIAEDEQINFALLNELLSHLNLKVYRAENGLEALNLCSGDLNPDLVLMDMKMPVMDGIEATVRIKKIKPGLPVIALTAFTSESDKERFFKAGCDDFIAKPIRKELLIKVLEKHLKTA